MKSLSANSKHFLIKTEKAVKAKVTKVPKPAKAVEVQKLRIRVRAYESKVLDASIKQIIDTARRFEATILGPIPLPTRIERYTVLRSPHIDKKSREQFEIRTHKRLIDIVQPTGKTIDALNRLSLPAGVDIKIKASSLHG